jgi:hypothetical protein
MDPDRVQRIEDVLRVSLLRHKSWLPSIRIRRRNQLAIRNCVKRFAKSAPARSRSSIAKELLSSLRTIEMFRDGDGDPIFDR